ncbi:hypothetical protein X797_010551 [Metarhizium robertsii]|uniref:Uncharacterized protein n=1 Tax=Metarhizium robertsii TaxID=568076 RepID=A0A014PKQ7_9HYPO|nr:hypothetical protein X797_010551 [Metarhizium robertsii]
MLALSFLLSAAAGVNAMLGSDIKPVKISNTTYICPTDCTYGGRLYQRVGNSCLESEIVVSSDWGSEDFYACNGTSPEGWHERPNDGGASECHVFQSIPNDSDVCDSER